MEYYLNQACITYRELIDGGVLTIFEYRNALNRKKIDVIRKGGNGREALIAYETLPPPIKLKVRQVYGDVSQQAIQSPLKKYYEVDVKAQDFFENYRYENGLRIKAEKLQTYVANASALNAVNRLIQANKTAKKKAGSVFKIGDVYQNFILPSLQSFKVEWGHTLPRSERQLREVLKKYDEQGYEGLISGKDCNENAVKAKESDQHALLRRLLSHANNFDYAQVMVMYNEVAKANAWKTLTRRTIENFAKENVLLTEGGRRGEVSFDNKLAMQHRRKSSPYPMMMWTVDGWDAELLYQQSTTDKKGNNITTYHNRPTVVVVLDPYHKYPIGYAIGDHETPELIRAAVRNALNHTAELFGVRHRPQQLQSDRYAQKTLTPFFEKVTPRYTPARVKNAKAKVIEPYFKDLNKGYCQYYNNWSGFGVTAKVDNQPNVEMRNKLRHSFPTWDGVKEQLETIIEKERAKKREAFVNGWEQLSDMYRLPWTTEQYLLNAGIRKERTVKMRGTMQFDIKGQEFHYDTFDPLFRHYTNEDWTLCYDPEDMNEVLAINKDESLRFLLQPIHYQSMDILGRGEDDAKQLATVKKYNKELKQAIMAQNAEDYELVEGLLNNTESDTLAKMLLVNSVGQHKDVLNAPRKMLAEKVKKEKPRKELPMPKSDIEKELDDYIERKNNFKDYL